MSVLKYSMVRTVEVATTYNQKYYDIIGKQMVESFVKHWPKHVKLHVYWLCFLPVHVKFDVLGPVFYKRLHHSFTNDVVVLLVVCGCYFYSSIHAVF